MDEPVVELRNVSLRSDRGQILFRDLDFTLERGESAIIYGGSGSGKTLLAEMLLGLRFPEDGTVTVLGQEIRRRRKRRIRRVRGRIGGVGGPFELVPSLTVAENITLPMVIHAERKKIQRDRLLKMLSEFSLLKLAGKYPRHLTRVENTLVQFARAFAANQPLVIIDEPSAGLDPASYERVFEYLVKVCLSGRSLLMLVSQEPPGKLPNSRDWRLVNGVLE
jgi:ABC-type lipoprotein export system ATPase subunit